MQDCSRQSTPPRSPLQCVWSSTGSSWWFLTAPRWKYFHPESLTRVWIHRETMRLWWCEMCGSPSDPERVVPNYCGRTPSIFVHTVQLRVNYWGMHHFRITAPQFADQGSPRQSCLQSVSMPALRLQRLQVGQSHLERRIRFPPLPSYTHAPCCRHRPQKPSNNNINIEI
jgi:hypothetical protein